MIFAFVLEQGEYELVREPTPDVTIDPFDVAVSETLALEPNPYFASLEEIRAHVDACRNQSG